MIKFINMFAFSVILWAYTCLGVSHIDGFTRIKCDVFKQNTGANQIIALVNVEDFEILGRPVTNVEYCTYDSLKSLFELV